MLRLLSKTIADKICEKGLVNREDVSIYTYGLEVLISTAFSFLTILVIGLLFSALFEAVFFLSVLVVLRRFTGGYHAKTYIGCNLSCSLLFITSLFLNRVLSFNLVALIIIHFLGLIIILLIAPVENINKPLSLSKRRVNKKRAVIACLALSMITILLFVIGSKFYSILTIAYIDLLVLLVLGFIISYRLEVKRNEEAT